MTTLVKRNGSPATSWPLFFDDFFNDFPVKSGFVSAPHVAKSVPAVNIKEDENAFFIELAAPGMKKSNFNIEVDSDRLMLSAENKEETADNSDGYSRREFCYSSFERSFSLPETVNSDKISAKYTDGILNIVLPKTESAKVKPARHIKIG